MDNGKFHIARTAVLDMAYEVSGPDGGHPLLLVHGWPDDVRTWDLLLPALHERGYRTVAPWLRGFGETKFLDTQTCRSGEIIALAKDILELAEALGLARFSIIGHDWGARIAYTLGAIAPDLLEQIVALSVPLNPDNPDELPVQQLKNYWYQWYFSSDLAEKRLLRHREEFVRKIWQDWATNLPDPDSALAATLPAFENEDWIPITLHSYRVRWKLARPDVSYSVLQSVLSHDLAVKVPLLSIRGEYDPVHVPGMYRLTPGLCTGGYEFTTIRGAGHFPQREKPAELAKAILAYLK